MKIISAHQPAYMPWLGYLHKVVLSDAFVIMDDVQFEKNSYTNRNKVLVNGVEVLLTIPVSSKNHFEKRIKDIEIADQRWKIKHLRTIEQAYRKCRYFEDVFPFFESGLSLNSRYFIDYSNYIFFEVIKYLGVDVPIQFASDLCIGSKKHDYVIELTKRLGGDAFLFGTFGRDYADIEKMNLSSVRPYFQDYIHPEYDQGGDKFISHLSIVDLLMRKGVSSLEVIMSGNVTKSSIEGK